MDRTLRELELALDGMGFPAFRARQIYQWVYRELVFDFDRMTNLPKALRDGLKSTTYVLPLVNVAESVAEDKLAHKALFRLVDGNIVESVLMLYPPKGESRARRTVCVSAQVGCGMGCAFCATGQQGLERNLGAGEIVGQVLFFARKLAQEGQGTVTNVVLMGQGEPLANLKNVSKAIEILSSPYGFNLGARHFTLSTVGLLPQIKELAQRHPQVGLAVSLHAPNDTLRNQLIPANRSQPVAKLMAACREYVEATHRRITFEYAMIADVNDGPAQARELGALLKGMICHVNLIPLNNVKGSPFKPSPQERVLAFQRDLEKRSIPTTVRAKRGTHIDAACGQLRARAADGLG
ncbi:MAG: 23S rRNA (adenine(2503)-C(2))-methyltransferase RlmN [Chloroflexi bacterium]|nr:23S rRNA (adenine(2503)-C(2))-methyltransferase RlmN [Chloroflexota bacterium]